MSRACIAATNRPGLNLLDTDLQTSTANNCLLHIKYSLRPFISACFSYNSKYSRISSLVSVWLGRSSQRSTASCAQWQQQPSSCFLSGYLTNPDKAAGPAPVSSSGLLTVGLRPHSIVVKLSGHDRESTAQ